MSMKMNQRDRDNELNALFAAYKAAVPDPDASANFMPELWRKIEARQSFTIRVRKLTQVFVGAAAAICLLFAMVLAVPVRIPRNCAAPTSTSLRMSILPPIFPPC